jgi:hypothetical protein
MIPILPGDKPSLCACNNDRGITRTTYCISSPCENKAKGISDMYVGYSRTLMVLTMEHLVPGGVLLGDALVAGYSQ